MKRDLTARHRVGNSLGGDERMVLPYTSGTEENLEGVEAP
jgi:hypothetical protein